jgi:hypothetical protein
VRSVRVARSLLLIGNGGGSYRGRRSHRQREVVRASTATLHAVGFAASQRLVLVLTSREEQACALTLLLPISRVHRVTDATAAQ